MYAACVCKLSTRRCRWNMELLQCLCYIFTYNVNADAIVTREFSFFFCFRWFLLFFKNLLLFIFHVCVRFCHVFLRRIKMQSSELMTLLLFLNRHTVVVCTTNNVSLLSFHVFPLFYCPPLSLDLFASWTLVKCIHVAVSLAMCAEKLVFHCRYMCSGRKWCKNGVLEEESKSKMRQQHRWRPFASSEVISRKSFTAFCSRSFCRTELNRQSTTQWNDFDDFWAKFWNYFSDIPIKISTKNGHSGVWHQTPAGATVWIRTNSLCNDLSRLTSMNAISIVLKSAWLGLLANGCCTRIYACLTFKLA